MRACTLEMQDRAIATIIRIFFIEEKLGDRYHGYHTVLVPIKIVLYAIHDMGAVERIERPFQPYESCVLPVDDTASMPVFHHSTGRLLCKPCDFSLASPAKVYLGFGHHSAQFTLERRAIKLFSPINSIPYFSVCQSCCRVGKCQCCEKCDHKK